MELICVYITFPTKEEAKSICGKLMEKQLIACANIREIDAIYQWNKEVINETEFAAHCKSSKAHWSSIKEEVTSLHSYDVPCITSWSITANQSYKDWIASSLKQH